MIVKGEPKPTFGTDPNEPWSARAGITESETSMLSSYLKSRGINPEFVGKDTKISHAKSTEFSKWKRDHNFDDPANYVSSTARDVMKAQREETIPEAKTIQGTALDKFRQAAAERARKHDDIERAMKARHAAGKEDMKGSIDRLEKHLNKEETLSELNYDTVKSLYKKRRDDFHGPEVGKKKKGKEVSAKNVSRSISRLSGFKPTQNQPQKEEVELNEVSSSEVQHHFHNWTNSEHAPYNSDAGDDNKVHQSALKYLRSTNVPKENHEKMAMHIANKFHGSGIQEESGASKEKETKFHKKLDKLVHGTFGKRKDEMKMKEDVQHKVGDSVTVNSKFFGKQKGKVTKVDNQSIHVQRNDKKTSEKYPHDAVVKEDVYQDPQAATQTAFDMGTTPNQTESKLTRKREMSKSARMIKALYKHNNMKEEIYDHEKEDKSVTTYGKKPKVEKVGIDGNEDNQAAMVLKGGKTLTGQERDDLEIDPVMRKPTNSDNKNSNKKTDK